MVIEKTTRPMPKTADVAHDDAAEADDRLTLREIQRAAQGADTRRASSRGRACSARREAPLMQCAGISTV